MKFRNVFLGLGCNIGNCRERFAEAEEMISGFARITNRSSVYFTKAYGNKDQNEFLNMVVSVETDLSPQLFLSKLQETERLLGRRERKKWDPREIDIDIIFWDRQIINEKELVVPHYDYKSRDFFLAPVSEISPGFIPPDSDQSVRELLKKIEEKTIIKKEKALEPVYRR